jgi:fluoride ion exporter CrcB/FEX
MRGDIEVWVQPDNLLDESREARNDPDGPEWCTTTIGQVATMLAIAFGAILGTLTRHGCGLYFSDLTSSDITLGGSIIFPDLPANMLGCFIMGVVVGLGPQIKSVSTQIFTGLGTGFCGCTTTFSGWISDAAEVLVGHDYSGVQDNGGTNLDAKNIQIGKAWMTLFVGFACTVACLELGHSFARLVLSVLEHTNDAADIESPGTKPRDLDAGRSSPGACVSSAADTFTGTKAPGTPPFLTPQSTMLLSALGASLTVLLLGFLRGWGNEITMAVLFAPPGALLRWKLGQNNKGGAASFPRFTFLANMLGTCGTALLLVLTNDTNPPNGGNSVVSDRGGSEFSTTLLGAIVLGFDGSLSTVSTLVSEYRGLQGHSLVAAYAYVAATMLGGMSISVFVMVVYVETYDTSS